MLLSLYSTMLETLVLVVCVLTHLYLSRRQEVRHHNHMLNLRCVVDRALYDKVISLTQSRQLRRQRAYNCPCQGEWEIRQQKMSLVDEIMGPMDRYIEDEMSNPAN